MERTDDTSEEIRERRGERRREETGAKRERRGERRERRGEKREERRQDDPGPKFPDWCRVWGVIILAMYVSRVRIRIRRSYSALNWQELTERCCWENDQSE